MNRKGIAALLFLCSLFSGAVHCRASVAAPTSEEKTASGTLKAVCLYTVADGTLRTDVFTDRQIEASRPIRVNGYVAGIIVLTDGESFPRADGRPMDRIAVTKEGNYILKYFGIRKPGDLMSETGAAGGHPITAVSGGGGNNGIGAFLPGGYSLFPAVKGDAVSRDDSFTIVVESAGRSLEIPIRQDGYRSIPNVCQTPGTRMESLVLRSVGVDSDLTESDEGRARFQAFAEGIAAAECTFGTRLVDAVNVVGYSGIRNAVTCAEGNDVWLYCETFRREPLAELQSIAAHESMHRLTAIRGFSRDSRVRELFADLKGYDDFSPLRFSVMASGTVPPGRREAEEPLFFAFIDERNFLPGMKGGHSGANPDEFCASFLHSLMTMDLLEENFGRPVTLPEGRSRVMTAGERRTILDRYIETIRIFLAVLSDRAGRSGLQPEDPAAAYLRGCLEKAKAARAG